MSNSIVILRNKPHQCLWWASVADSEKVNDVLWTLISLMAYKDQFNCIHNLL